jgi:hypothetical protein
MYSMEAWKLKGISNFVSLLLMRKNVSYIFLGSKYSVQLVVMDSQYFGFSTDRLGRTIGGRKLHGGL